MHEAGGARPPPLRAPEGGEARSRGGARGGRALLAWVLLAAWLPLTATFSVMPMSRSLTRARVCAGGARPGLRIGGGVRGVCCSAMEEPAVAAGSEGGEDKKKKKKTLIGASLEELKAVMHNVLEDQWESASEIEVAQEREEKEAKKGPKHVVGGFSVVLRLPEQGIAYRLQPMDTFKAGMTWVAFHEAIANKATDTAAVDSAMMNEVLFTPDRDYVLGPAKPRKRSWEETDVAIEYQAERLRQSTIELVRARRQLLATSSEAFKRGECTSTLNCPIEPELDGGQLDHGGVMCGMLIPTSWFWHQVGRPEWEPADATLLPTETLGTGTVRGPAKQRSSQNNARSDSAHRNSAQANLDADAPRKRKRMKGIELADALMLPRQGSGAVKGGLMPPVPPTVEAAPVNLLVSVFVHAQGDVGGLNKRLWSAGAPDNITVLVMQSVARGLRTLHSMGIPHGDLKPANVLYTGGQFCLTDMPALNWTATPVLTKDPVVHTMVRGKRFLCNDMWGLGMVALGLVCGYKRFESIKETLRGIDPKYPQPLGKMDRVTSHWLVVILLLLSDLGDASAPPADETARSARKAVRSEWLARQVPAVRVKEYVDSCKAVADQLKQAVLRPDRSTDLLTSLVYCLDVTDISRNALAMPWPYAQEGDDSVSEDSTD